MIKLIFATALTLAVAACGTPGATGTPPAEQPGGTAAVAIADFAYHAATLNIPLGSTVTWTNNDNVPHTVTFDGGQDSGNMAPGATFQQTFTEAGTFAYSCTIHPSMTGSVSVGN